MVTRKTHLIEYLSLILIIGGIFFFILGIQNYFLYKDYADNGQTVLATIFVKESEQVLDTHYNNTSSNIKIVYYFKVSFTEKDSFNVHLIKIDNVEESIWRSKSVDDKIDIIYIKDNPESAMIKEQYNSQTQLVLPMTVISGLSFILGITTYLISKSRSGIVKI
jgi:hypothetical protein